MQVKLGAKRNTALPTFNRTAVVASRSRTIRSNEPNPCESFGNDHSKEPGIESLKREFLNIYLVSRLVLETDACRFRGTLSLFV